MEIPSDSVAAEQPLLDYHQRGGVFYPLIQLKLQEGNAQAQSALPTTPKNTLPGLPWLRNIPGSA